LLQKSAAQDPNTLEEILNAVTPLEWSTGIPGRAAVDLIKVELKPDTKPVRKKQYPIKMDAKIGLE